jgi:hypothetical protein
MFQLVNDTHNINLLVGQIELLVVLRPMRVNFRIWLDNVFCLYALENVS